MPGMSLTLAQAARLFNLPRGECSSLFDELQRQGLIEVGLDGLYRRPTGE
jgi:DNA-binding IclR family transcriptional regulator